MAITIRDNSTASSHRGFFNPLREHELDSRSESIALPSAVPKASMWHRFGLGRWLHRDEPTSGSSSPTATDHRGNLSRRLSRKVGAVGLPRQATFGRQNSEQRDRLTPIEPPPRRTQSADRRRTLSVQRTHSPVPSLNIARLSAPEVGSWSEQLPGLAIPDDESTHEYLQDAATLSQVDSNQYNHYDNRSVKADTVDDALERELERKWILNLSMHFRDKSEREKFFVTYAERPNRWRRVTISCDYRNAPEDSLERDLKELHYQRDKSARIYESIRESLPEIQFYDTVTNLKLETSDGRLHVHVTEDVNETIPYPPLSSVRHLGNRLIPECDLIFDSHLSGFVYKVQWDGKAYIKKEIPGPDTVDEFLYEINALHALYGSQSVIQFEGIIVDDRFERVKGLLISYAEQGALVDVLYDFRGQLSLDRRERWARQIVQGLCEIHEAGYVQGDFTLSNIVIDGNDNAKIIDINRRGCPVGWEPPEIAAKIESNQRISMYIGVKSDLFQLGMTLWALAMQEDEPERQPRPLFIPVDMKIPEYYRRIVAHCLSDRPRDRLSAKELLIMFPHSPQEHHDQVHDVVLPPWTAYPPGPPYYETVQMDTNQPFCLDNHQEPRRPSVAYVTPAECDSESDFPEIDFPPRGRRQSVHEVPPSDNQSSAYIPSNASPIRDHRRSVSQSDFEVDKNSFPAMTAEPHFEEAEIAGTHYLVNPNMLSTETFDTLGDNACEPYAPHSRSSDRSHSVAPASDEEPKDVISELKAHVVPTKADLSNADGPEYRQEADRARMGNAVDDPSLYQVDDRKFPLLNNDEERRADEPVPIASASSAPVSPVISPENQEREESGISLETRAHSILREIPLLQSNLPINPRVSRVIPPSTQSTGKRRSSLFSSKLPINPALSQTTPRRSPPSRRNSLFGSLLPINPALPQNTSSRAIPQGGISQSASNPSVNSIYQHAISTTRPGKFERPTSAMKRLSYLLDSVLPINPAVSARRRDRTNSDII